MPRGKSGSKSPRSGSRRNRFSGRPGYRRRNSSSSDRSSRDLPRRSMPDRRPSPPRRPKSDAKSKKDAKSSSSSRSGSSSSSITSSKSRSTSLSSSSSSYSSSSGSSVRRPVRLQKRSPYHDRPQRSGKKPVRLHSRSLSREKNSNRYATTIDSREKRAEKYTDTRVTRGERVSTRFHDRASPPAARDRHSKRDDKESERKQEAPKVVPKPKSTIIHVSNVSRNVFKEHLYDIFSIYGKIVEIDLPLNVELKNPVGYARITFETEEECLVAKEHMNHGQIDGKNISVELVSPPISHDEKKEIDAPYKKRENLRESPRRSGGRRGWKASVSPVSSRRR